LYAVTTRRGLEGWSAGSYLQNEVLDGGGVSFEIGQQSNGALASVELAAARLAAAPDRPAALIAAADTFPAPWWDRWRAGWGLVFADGAAAAVLSRRGGFARIASAVTVSDPGLEGMHRGSLPFVPSDKEHYPVDFRARSLDYTQSGDLAEVSRRMAGGVRRAVTRAAEEAGLAVPDADHVIVPGFGRTLLLRECLDPLGVPLDRTTWNWAAHVGHLGAADQFAALAHLSESGRLTPGDRVLVISVGGGFNWTCVVLDIADRPAWSA
jgi:3-oxoacyl-[acyl-carrier-protein] synthase-3